MQNGEKVYKSFRYGKPVLASGREGFAMAMADTKAKKRKDINDKRDLTAVGQDLSSHICKKRNTEQSHRDDNGASDGEKKTVNKSSKLALTGRSSSNASNIVTDEPKILDLKCWFQHKSESTAEKRIK